jgi:uncharacterized damage-inducible protein DinB
MIDNEQLTKAFALNLNLIRMHTKDLTHQDSLLQPPFQGNCLNWVLGHVAVNRNRVLQLIGEEMILTEDEAARYEAGSEPITKQEDGVLSLVMLLAALERAQKDIEAGMQRVTAEELASKIQIGQQSMTVGQRLFGLYFHETYHTGQTELLRQLASTEDKVR